MSRIFRVAAAALFLPGCYLAADVEPNRADAEYQVAGEYVVGISDAGSEADIAALAAREGLEIAELRNGERLAVLVATSPREPADVIAALDSDEATAFAEPQYRYTTSRSVNDYGDYMWGLNNTGLSGGVQGADIDAFAAWDLATGAGVVVAVIDTGVDVTHPDLAPNLWRNPGEIAGNGVDDDGNGYIDDVNGYDFVNRDSNPNDLDSHGTHVAGSVAAQADDDFGVPGVAFDANVMCLKFLERNRGGYSSMAAEAINYAVNNGAHIINASWGGPGQSSAIRNAIAYARSRGVLFVTAAGNEGSNNDTYGNYPSNYALDNIISVAASDRRDGLASFSNYGSNQVDLAAPGVDIVSTVPGETWGYMDGTSMASPYVAGAAALLKSVAPSMTVQELRLTLLSSVDPLAAGAGGVATGGRLNARAALDLVIGEDGEGAEEEPPPSEEEPPPLADWKFVAFPIESPHPYSDNFSGQIQIVAPEGATELKLHFDRIDVEANYDFVVVRDEEGTKLAEWTGDLGAVTSQVFAEPSVRLFLFTDGSVTDWGLALDGFSWR